MLHGEPQAHKYWVQYTQLMASACPPVDDSVPFSKSLIICFQHLILEYPSEENWSDPRFSKNGFPIVPADERIHFSFICFTPTRIFACLLATPWERWIVNSIIWNPYLKEVVRDGCEGFEDMFLQISTVLLLINWTSSLCFLLLGNAFKQTRNVRKRRELNDIEVKVTASDDRVLLQNEHTKQSNFALHAYELCEKGTRKKLLIGNVLWSID